MRGVFQGAFGTSFYQYLIMPYIFTIIIPVCHFLILYWKWIEERIKLTKYFNIINCKNVDFLIYLYWLSQKNSFNLFGSLCKRQRTRTGSSAAFRNVVAIERFSGADRSFFVRIFYKKKKKNNDLAIIARRKSGNHYNEAPNKFRT